MRRLKIELFSVLFFAISLLMVHVSSRANHISGSVLAITIDEAIAPFVGDYVKSAIAKATLDKASMLLIRLDTPGGLYDTTREIVQSILVSTVPIVVYVAPPGARAGSAGVFIALAAHLLAMAPSTNIGAAHPVDISGGDVKGDMKEKITNDTKAWARSIAETRHRNAEWAEKAVVGSESISAMEAQKIHVIDLMAHDETELLSKLDGREVELDTGVVKLNVKNAQIVEYPLSLSQRLMKFLSNPNLLYILLLLGILGILLEFQSPGLILPGLLGVLCLAIVFGVQVLPINWFGALLILGAAASFIAELFVTSFGILAILGLSLLIVGSYLLFNVSGSPFFVEPLIIWSIGAGFAVIILALGVVMLRARRRAPASNVFALVGEVGKVSETIDPVNGGVVLLHGTYWQAFADEKIHPPSLVVVKRVESTKLFVERKDKE